MARTRAQSGKVDSVRQHRNACNSVAIYIYFVVLVLSSRVRSDWVWRLAAPPVSTDSRALAVTGYVHFCVCTCTVSLHVLLARRRLSSRTATPIPNK
jgi:hypothetical protein